MTPTLVMNQKERDSAALLMEVNDGRLPADEAAERLDLNRRQVFRLLKRYRAEGDQRDLPKDLPRWYVQEGLDQPEGAARRRDGDSDELNPACSQINRGVSSLLTRSYICARLRFSQCFIHQASNSFHETKSSCSIRHSLFIPISSCSSTELS
jgi:hypothetical protein